MFCSGRSIRVRARQRGYEQVWVVYPEKEENQQVRIRDSEMKHHIESIKRELDASIRYFQERDEEYQEQVKYEYRSRDKRGRAGGEHETLKKRYRGILNFHTPRGWNGSICVSNSYKGMIAGSSSKAIRASSWYTSGSTSM